jgi:hypothetical protein
MKSTSLSFVFLETSSCYVTQSGLPTSLSFKSSFGTVTWMTASESITKGKKHLVPTPIQWHWHQWRASTTWTSLLLGGAKSVFVKSSLHRFHIVLFKLPALSPHISIKLLVIPLGKTYPDKIRIHSGVEVQGDWIQKIWDWIPALHITS